MYSCICEALLSRLNLLHVSFVHFDCISFHLTFPRIIFLYDETSLYPSNLELLRNELRLQKLRYISFCISLHTASTTIANRSNRCSFSFNFLFPFIIFMQNTVLGEISLNIPQIFSNRNIFSRCRDQARLRGCSIDTDWIWTDASTSRTRHPRWPI